MRNRNFKKISRKYKCVNVELKVNSPHEWTQTYAASTQKRLFDKVK